METLRREVCGSVRVLWAKMRFSVSFLCLRSSLFFLLKSDV